MKRQFQSYHNFVCYRCFRQLHQCTCSCFPPYSLIHIDTGIQDAIRVLNEKGYCSNGCCEGHYQGVCQSTYVSFIRDFFKEDTEMPEGFRWQKRRNMLFHDYYKCTSEEEMEQEKEQMLRNLLDWCEKLPDSPLKRGAGRRNRG